MSALTVFCYGVIGVDRMIRVAGFPERDGHARVISESEHVGGEAANTAVTLAAMGLNVRLAGNAIGDDAGGRFLREALGGVPGLDCSRVAAEEGTTTGHAIVISDGEARTILGAFPDLRAPEVTEADLAGVSLLSVDPFLGDAAVRAASLAFGSGIPVVSIELSGRHPLAGLARVVINSSGFMRRHEMGDPEEVATSLLEAGVTTFVLTRGASGCRIYDRGGTVDVPAAAVDAVDTTGAGDAFRAGFIRGALDGSPTVEAARLGAAAAALTCCGTGGCGHVSGLDAVRALADAT